MNAPPTELKKGLKQRHLTMIAMGGVIGAGLFVGSGTVIGGAGPAAFLTYAITGVLIILVMRMLGEMATANPSTGSFAASGPSHPGDGSRVSGSRWPRGHARCALDAFRRFLWRPRGETAHLIPLRPLPPGRPDGRSRHPTSQPRSQLPVEPPRRRLAG